MKKLPEDKEKEIEKPKSKIDSLFDRQISAKTFYLTNLILLGASLVFLGIIYFISSSTNLKNDWRNYIPVTRPAVSLNLEINYPEDESLLFEKNISLSGKTSFGSTVIISKNSAKTSTDLALSTTLRGDFSKVITLEPGLNELTVTAFDRSGNSKTKQLSIYYSEEKIQ